MLLKHTLRYFALLPCAMALFFLLAYLHTLPAYAAGNAQITIQPMVGRPGTQVQISGSGFSQDGTLRLFTTPNPGKCSGNGSPASLGLLPFNTSPTVTVNNGAFTLNTTWPGNAATPTTPYYICGIGPGGQGPNFRTLSSNTFTIAQAVTITVNPTSAAPGDQVTITGANWLPPQQLNISVTPGGGGQAIATTSVNSDNNGNFSTTLTIPATAQPGTYTVQVVAANETTMTATNPLTVQNKATPTPTAGPSPTAAPSPTVTASPTPANGGNTTGGPSNALFYVMGVIGVLLVIVGIALFVVYSRIR
jgi:hypothetical protein